MFGLRKLNEAPVEPLIALPASCQGLKVCLKCVGGIGDTIIACASTALAIAREASSVTLAVREGQVEFFKAFRGIDFVIEASKLNRHDVRTQFDVYVDFYGTFANSRQLRNQDYYELVEQRIKREVPLPKLIFEYSPQPKTVAIHPGASNPNRQWPTDRWEKVADAFISNGWHVYWLGSKDEFGFTNARSTRLADQSNSIRYQAEKLAQCSYFLGNDSGYGHIAGILGVPGLVLFSANYAHNVIKRYSSLKGIDSFDKVQYSPNFSLRQDDPVTIAALQAITVEQVLAEVGIEIAAQSSEKQYSKPQITLVGTLPYVLAENLGKTYDFKRQDNPQLPYIYWENGLVFKAADREYRLSDNLQEIINGLRTLLSD